MTTVKEDYCSFELAKLLKEKGFDEPCQHFYKLDSNEIYRGTVFTNTQIGDKFYNAPTHQMAMKWLREVHNQHIQINYMHGAYQEFDYVVINTFNGKAYHEPVSFSSYEEAVEAALKYSLKNLI